MRAERRRLGAVEPVFGIEAASRLLLDALPGWVQELGLLVEVVETSRPTGAPEDWLPGAVLRLPFSKKLSRDGAICPQALLALAETAMMLACAAAWSGYRPMNVVDQTTHFLRPANFDVLADARVVRIGRDNTFGRATLSSAMVRRPVGMVSSTYSIL
jgi:acyl-coenzyme A thioesterase PaaI-like protein